MHTYSWTDAIISIVKTPNTLYSFLLHPIVKNTFSLKWQLNDGCHFFISRIYPIFRKINDIDATKLKQI